MPSKDYLQRVAFSPAEFAALFGKSQTWGYRQIYAGKVKAVTEYGRILIPAAEVERVLGKAGEYLRRKTKPTVKKDTPWARYVKARRKKTGNSRPPVKTPKGVAKTKAGQPQSMRAAALARLANNRR